MAAAREKERPLKSGMESLRCESSTFAREEEQKSNDSLTAATSFSLASVSLSFAVCGAATPEIFEQKRLLDSAMCKARCAKVIWSPVGLKENLSAGMGVPGAGAFFGGRVGARGRSRSG